MAPLHKKRIPLIRLCPVLFLLLFESHQLDAKIKFEENIRPILERSCLKCHGGEKVKGEVDFSKIKTETDSDSRFELWETVTEMIDAGEMPPEDNPQLSPEEKSMILDFNLNSRIFDSLSIQASSIEKEMLPPIDGCRPTYIVHRFCVFCFSKTFYADNRIYCITFFFWH